MAAPMGEQAAENPNLTLGEGSGCGGAEVHHQSDFNVRAQALLKKIDPNYDPREITKKYCKQELKEKMFCDTLELILDEHYLSKDLKELQEKHDELKNSYQELMRAREANKKKILDLETRAMAKEGATVSKKMHARKRPRSGKAARVPNK